MALITLIYYDVNDRSGKEPLHAEFISIFDIVEEMVDCYSSLRNIFSIFETIMQMTLDNMVSKC